MDHRIYGKLNRNDYGVYGTRRYPKGVPSAGTGADMSDPANRNPVTIALRHSAANVVPHTNTERWTYTVPRMRRAILQSALAELNRVTVGAANGLNTAGIFIKRAGTTTNVQVVARNTNDNAISPGLAKIHTGQIDLYEGDILAAFTNTNDGNFNLLTAAHLIEYDAVEKIIGFESVESSEGAGTGVGGAAAPSGGGYRQMIRVEPGNEFGYIAQGWTNLGGGFLGRN